MARRYNAPGTDYDVSVASIITGIGTGDFTWCGWVWNDTVGSGAYGLFGNGAAAPAIYLAESGSVVQWSLYWGGFNTFDTLALGGSAWKHLCVTRTGTTITGYVDGVAEATTHTVATSWTDAQVTIGAADTAGSAGAPDETQLAEHAIWSRALSVAEIGSLAAGFAPNWYPRDLKCYTPLYRGGVALVQDYVTNGVWTENGTVGTRPGPAIIRPIPRLDFQVTEHASRIESTAAGRFPTSLQPHINALENASPFAWLFEVELPTVPPTRFRFCNQTKKIAFGIDSAGDPIEYDPFNVEIGEWTQGKSGDLPELSVAVSNVRRDVGTALEDYAGLHGAPCVIRIVNKATLFDLNAQMRFDGEVRGCTVTTNSATFAIASYNLYQETVPAHRFLRNHCGVLFGAARCGYPLLPAGTATNVVGGGFDFCRKHLDACTERGADEVARGLEEKHPKRFGGFRGLVRLSSKVALQ